MVMAYVYLSLISQMDFYTMEMILGYQNWPDYISNGCVHPLLKWDLTSVQRRCKNRLTSGTTMIPPFAMVRTRKELNKFCSVISDRVPELGYSSILKHQPENVFRQFEQVRQLLIYTYDTNEFVYYILDCEL